MFDKDNAWMWAMLVGVVAALVFIATLAVPGIRYGHETKLARIAACGKSNNVTLCLRLNN